MAEALTLAKALRDLLRDTIGINIREHRQVPVYLREGVGTAHVGLPNRTTGLGTVTTLVVNWAWKKETLKFYSFYLMFCGYKVFFLNLQE